MSEPGAPTRRPGWLVASFVAGAFAGTIAVVGLWALAETVETGSGSTWRVITGTGAGVVFWSWIAAGCWRHAHEPEPGPYEPAPVPRSRAFVAANVVLALLFTALVAGGLWAGVESARETQRLDLIEHRVMVAARAADVTVDSLRDLSSDRQVWIAQGWGDEPSDDPDPGDLLLPVDGASVADVAVEETENRAAVLFRPHEGPPCVVLDVDSHGLLSTRTTNNC